MDQIHPAACEVPGRILEGIDAPTQIWPVRQILVRLRLSIKRPLTYRIVYGLIRSPETATATDQQSGRQSFPALEKFVEVAHMVGQRERVFVGHRPTRPTQRHDVDTNAARPKAQDLIDRKGIVEHRKSMDDIRNLHSLNSIKA
jgi:hypothetical protein